MPIHQIAVAPVTEATDDGKSSPRSKDKREASSSAAGLGTASQTSATTPCQDTCSPPARLEAGESEATAPSKPTTTPVMAINSAALGSPPPIQKKVKRRRRQKKDGSSSAAAATADADPKEEPPIELERVKSEGEVCERPSNRTSAPPHLDSSEEEEGEGGRKDRSWSKEKAKRGARNRGKGADDKGGDIELQSIGSDEGKENRAPPEDKGNQKKRHRGSPKREGHGSRRESRQRTRDERKKACGPSAAGGSGGGDMSVPTPRTQCGVNGGTTRPRSEDSELEVCRICHCEGDAKSPLITPCLCTGSLRCVHMSCLNQWIKSSDTRCCELCKFYFLMDAHLKPLRKWKKLQMSKAERNKILWSVFFHLLAIGCLIWSVCLLVKRTVEDIRLGRDEDFWRPNMLRFFTREGKAMPAILDWPFWTKLNVVVLSFIGSLVFMYIQWKVYWQLWCRLKAFNRIITVHNCPQKDPSCSPGAPPANMANGMHGAVVVPITDSDRSVEAAVASCSSSHFP